MKTSESIIKEKFDTSVLLINWEDSNIIFNVYYSFYPPLGLAYMASVLRKDIKNVKIIDAPIEKYTEQDVLKRIKLLQPKFIGFSTYTPQIYSVLKLCKKIKEIVPNTTIILGGPHVFFEYKEIMKNNDFVDYCIRGEGEYSFPKLIKNLLKKRQLSKVPGLVYKKNNKLIVNEPEVIKKLDDLPFPSRDLLPYKKYRAVQCLGGNKQSTSVMVSRGCLFRCTYCASKALWNQNLRFRSPENVIEEMIELQNKYNIKYVRFNDDLFTFNKDWVKKFCELYHKNNLKIKWVCDSRVECVDEEILRLMKKAGCKLIYFGIEFGNKKILNSVGKYFTKEQVRRAVDLTNKAGIDSYGFFMLGYPGETIETMKETINFSLNLNLDWAGYYIVTPYPGTKLYHHCKENELLRSKDWREYHTRARPIIKSKNFSEKELLNLYSSAQKKFYLRPKYFIKRLFRIRPKDFYFALIFVKRYIESRLKINRLTKNLN